MTVRHRFGAFAPLCQAFLALLLFVLLPGAAPPTARAATIAWNNAAGGDWNADINWLGGFKPGPGDVARIALGGSFTVTLSGTATVAGLELGSPGGAEALAINGGTLTVNGPATTTATARITLAGAALNGGGPLTLDGTLEARGASSIGVPLSVTAGGTLRSVGSSGAAVLTLVNGFTNSGKLELTNDVAGAHATLNVTGGGVIVAPGAQLRSLAGAGGGTRTLGARLDNRGTLDISHPLSIAKSGAAHLNSGVINVSGGDLIITQSGASPSFGTSGTITIGAGRTLAVNGGAFEQTAGGITGATGTLALSTVAATFASALSTASVGLNPTNCTLDGAGLTNASGRTLTLTGDIVNMAVTNAGTLVTHGSNSFTAGLTTQSASTLRVEGSAAGPGTLTITGAVTNNGTLELTSSGAAQDATLNFISGSLTNAPGRTLSALAGAGGNRVLGGALNNQGQLTVDAPLALNVPGADHLNSGAITLGAGDLTVTQSGATPSFGTSGTITLGAGRTLTVTGGAFSQTAGTIGGATGTLTLTNVAVTLTPGFTAGACFLNLVGCTLGGGPLTIPVAKLLTLRDDTINTTVDNSGTLALSGVCALNGTFLQQAGATLRVEGSGFGAAAATVAAGFTNNGTIEITTNSLGQNAALTVTSGTLINATGREIKSTVGSGGGTRALNAQLDNRGLVTVGATLGVTRTSAAHLNSGTINLTGGSLTFDQGGAGPSVTNSGTITLGTARTLTCDAGAFTNAAGGTLQGAGTLAVGGASLHNAGTIRPGTSPGVLTVTGDLVCDPTSLLVLELGGASPGGGYDRLAVSGAVTLDGALQLTLINGFVPAGGSAFNVIQWGGHTGDFASVTGLNPLPEVVLAADPAGPGYGATGLTFVVLTQTWAALTPTGTAPTARAGASAVYDAASNRLIVFGGRAAGGVQNDVRILVNANGLGGTPTWVALSPTGSPPAARQGHGAVYDAANNRMIVFGGDNGQPTPTIHSDVWVLSGANGLAGAGAWTSLAPGGSAPGALTQAAVAYNAASNRLIVFGGQGAVGCDARNDLHVLTNANGLGGAPAWLAPAVAGSAPSARARAGATYDTAGNRLIVYGGDGLCGAPLTDAFVLADADANGGTPTWAPLALTNAPAPGISGADGGFDPAFNRLVTFGGRRGDGSTLGDDTILFFDANGAGAPPRWSLLPPTLPRPAARWRQASAYDAANHRLIVFGGDTSINTPSLLNDVWVLTVNVANDAVSAVDDPPAPGDWTTGGFVRAPTPNPTTGALAFTIGVTGDGRVSVALFDVRGRLVRALFDGELPAGPAEFAWDGRDDAGARVAAGVYFVRAWTVAGSVARRVVVVP